MLDTIKQAIVDLPDIPFEEYYQQYVQECSSRVVEHNVQRSSLEFRNIEDIPSAIKGLNTLTSEFTRMQGTFPTFNSS